MAKRKQGFLPEMEPPHIAEIDDAADHLNVTRAKRMELTERESKAADLLLALMHKHGLTTYEFDGLVVTVETAKKVKVKRKKEPGEDGDE